MVDHFDANEISIGDALFSVCINLLKEKNILHKGHVQAVLSKYPYCSLPFFESAKIPKDEFDFLGLFYQCLRNEGEKNIKGAYYTPRNIIKKMLEDTVFRDNATVFDPCCGSGAFLLEVSVTDPKLLFGIDIDPIAVMIAQVNLLLKFSDFSFPPQVFCLNYLSSPDLSSLISARQILNQKFDYIITNPPWGAISPLAAADFLEITSKETFSCFMVKAFSQLNNNGELHFLLPEAILNVRTHKDIRHFILTHGCLTKILFLNDAFSGVITKIISVSLSNALPQKTFEIIDINSKVKIPKSSVLNEESHAIRFLWARDIEILDNIYAMKKYSLNESLWGLGIVTGDNKNKLSSTMNDGDEAIFTGKEITPYVLKGPRHFIRYEREKFQQVAPDLIYRAAEKLVYKFISKNLVFAYDNMQRLFLNSANILIPEIPGMSVKTVLAFLNSELFQYIYIKKFGEIKILKGNLLALPFPAISSALNIHITGLVDKIIIGHDDMKLVVDDCVFDSFSLDLSTRLYIKEQL